MLYSGQIVIVDTFLVELAESRSKLSYKKPYIAYMFIADNCYSGHNFLAPRENFKANLPLYSWHLIFFMEKQK